MKKKHLYLFIANELALINLPETRHWELLADIHFDGLGSLFKRESGLIMQGVLLSDPREVVIFLSFVIVDDIVFRIENGNLHLLAIPLQSNINLTEAKLSELSDIFNRENGLHGRNISDRGGPISHEVDLLEILHRC